MQHTSSDVRCKYPQQYYFQMTSYNISQFFYFHVSDVKCPFVCAGNSLQSLMIMASFVEPWFCVKDWSQHFFGHYDKCRKDPWATITHIPDEETEAQAQYKQSRTHNK